MALTNDQKSALDLGHSVFIGDQACVGKSFLGVSVYHELLNRDKRIVLTCTTGIACCKFPKIHCSQLNAYLVHVENETENAFLKSHLNGLKEGNYWMSLTDIDKEGEFKWYGTEKIAMFTDWIGDQPDDYGGGEDCVHFNSEHDYKRNDNPCEYKSKAICEKKQN